MKRSLMTGKHRESGNVSPWIAFFIVIAFFLLLGVAVFGKQPARHQGDHGSGSAARIVNVTLDTVMWIHDQHRGKLTWAELNDEVCRHMRVKRTEPWQHR